MVHRQPHDLNSPAGITTSMLAATTTTMTTIIISSRRYLNSKQLPSHAIRLHRTVPTLGVHFSHGRLGSFQSSTTPFPSYSLTTVPVVAHQRTRRLQHPSSAPFSSVRPVQPQADYLPDLLRTPSAPLSTIIPPICSVFLVRVFRSSIPRSPDSSNNAFSHSPTSRS